MRGWCAASAMRGVQMQLEQSRVGKTLLRPTITPPIEGVPLDQQDLVALLAQVERRLHAGDPAADHQRVVPLADVRHGRYLRTLAQHRRRRGSRIAHLERHLARQAVGGAAEARVVGAEGHLDHVQEALVDLDARADQTPCAACLIDMQMAAWLLVVPTIRFTFCTIPFSSVT